MSERSRELTVSGLARVEGEGALRITVHDGQVTRAELSIYEPPRFFEAFLRGRSYTEPPDLTARICGICPVAYQASACNAIEQVCGAQLTEPLAELRRLLYCGEWISSHALHIYLLHAPDFLGYPDAISLARDHRDIVERGLELKKAGNAILEQVGGRAIHPVNVRVGGSSRAPARPSCARWPSGSPGAGPGPGHGPLGRHLRVPRLRARARPARRPRCRPLPPRAGHVVRPRAVLPGRRVPRSCHRGAGPALDRAARHPRRAPLPDGAAGPVLAQLRRPVPAGPPGRGRAGLGAQCRNPFRSILVRGVEIVYAVEEALRIIGAYERPGRPSVEVAPRAGTGHGVSEAPRGLLYHRYDLDGDGLIRAAAIVPPTSQNLAVIEDNLRLLAGRPGPGRRIADRPVRAGDPEPRSVHLVRSPFSLPNDPHRMSGTGAAGGTGPARSGCGPGSGQDDQCGHRGREPLPAGRRDRPGGGGRDRTAAPARGPGGHLGR